MTANELADLIRRLTRCEGWLTVREAAEYVRTQKGTVYGWIKSGQLPAYAPVEGRMIVRLKDLDGLCRKHLIFPGEDRESPHAAAAAAAVAARKAKRAATQEETSP